MNPKKSEQEKQNNQKTKNAEKHEEKEKKPKKSKKEENTEVQEKKSKLKELLESKDDDKKEAKKAKIKSKKSKEAKKKKEYSIEFIMKLKDTKIANEELLLSKEVKEHFEKIKKDVELKRMKTMEDKPSNKEKNDNLNLSKKSSKVKNKIDEKAEEEFKKSFNEALKDKNIEEKLNYYLDKINLDNYDFVRKEILELIKDSAELQDKFVDAVIKTSISKSPFCEIYAKLCKNLDKELPKKSEGEDKKAESKKGTSLMKINLIDKTRVLFTSEKFEEGNKDEHKYEKDNRLKKNMFGITHFLIELIKVHILSKKVVSSCFQSLFSRYEKNKSDEALKAIYIETIIIFVELFEKLILSKDNKLSKEETEEYAEKVDEIIKKLEQIKEEVKERYLKYKITNFIEKRKKDYPKTKFEIYLEERTKKEPIPQEKDKFSQDVINDRIEKGLNDYIDFVEKEGASDKYEWIDETFLIEKRGQGLDDILEAYFLNCGNTSEKDKELTKNYIKELIEYYIGQKNEKEKNDLKNRLIKIFEIVRNDIPIMNEIYSNTINMFLENQIMDIIDLDSIGNELSKEEIVVMDKILKNLNELSKEKTIKEELAKLKFVGNNKDSFKWLFIKP
jgi:hypothetical protein